MSQIAEMLPYSPMRLISTCKPDDARFFTNLEYRQLLEAARQHKHGYWVYGCIVGWETGLPLRETSCLVWSSVDIENDKALCVPYTTRRGERITLEIPIMSELFTLLKAQMGHSSKISSRSTCDGVCLCD